MIASAAIVLAWLRTKEEERSQKINELSVLVTCRSDTLAMLFSEVNSPVAHGSTRYGSWRPLTNLTQTFQACHNLCTLNVIFFRAIPTYGQPQLESLCGYIDVTGCHIAANTQ